MLLRPSLVTACFLALLPAAGSAQRVVADIGIHHGPVSGRIVIGHPEYHRPHRVVEVRPRYYAPRTVVVVHMRRGAAWYHRHGFRTVRVWYDRRGDRYYDRYDRSMHGLRTIVVYERGGRYYHDDGRDDYRGRVGGRRDDHRDSHDDRDDDRFDDRFDDRDDDRYHDRR